MAKETVYISSAMTGKENFNRDEFMEVDSILTEKGYEVINPIKLDDEHGTEGLDHFDFLKRDIDILVNEADAICVFGDWRNSRGSTDELYVANICGLSLYYLDSEGNLQKNPDIPAPMEAKLAVLGSRRADYGHPADNLSHTARIWNGILAPKIKEDCEIDIRDVCMAMIGLKMSREYNVPDRDNVVDGVGYFYCYREALLELERRGHDRSDFVAEHMQKLYDNACEGFDLHRKED